MHLSPAEKGTNTLGLTAARHSEFAPLALSATVLFFLSFVLHYPFHGVGNSTDVIPLWYRAQSQGGGVPYVNYPFEYPALSGALFYVSTLAGSVYGFYYGISLILYSFMIVGLYTTWKILRLVGQPISGISRYVILTPTFLLYSIFSFDWIGVSLLLLAVYFSYGRRPLPSGVFLGLSIASRLIPVVCLPFVTFKFRRARERAILLAACGGAWLAPNLYFMIVNFQGFLYPYLFQANYPYEDSWLEIIYAFSPIGTKILSALLLLSLLAVILLWWDRFSLLEGSMLAMLAFVLSSYKFPPQYMILLIPLFALNRVSYRLSFTANTLNVLIFLLWVPSIPFIGDPTHISSPVQWVAILRQLVLLPIFLSYLLARRTGAVPVNRAGEKRISLRSLTSGYCLISSWWAPHRSKTTWSLARGSSGGSLSTS